MRRELTDDDRGAALVEAVLAIIFILVPLLAGVTDLGRALYVSIVMEEAAQEGAVFAANTGANDSATATHVGGLASFPDLSGSTVTRICTPISRLRENGSEVTVSISFTLDNFILPNTTLQQDATAEGVAQCP